MTSPTILAQLVTVFTVPLIARIFSSDQIGLFQLYLSTAAVMLSLSTLQYDLAIIIPDSDDEADEIIQLCAGVLIAITSIFCCAFYFLSQDVLEFFGIGALKPFVLIISVSVFINGLSQIYNQILVRQGKYGTIGLIRLFSVIISRGFILIVGMLFPGLYALLAGTLVGKVFELVSSCLYSKNFRGIYPGLPQIRCALKYIKYPLFNLSEGFINNLGMQLPVFIISKYFGPHELGYYSMALRIVNIPMTAVAYAVGKIYFKEAAEAYNIGIQQLYMKLVNSVKKLAFIGLAMIVPIVIFAKYAVILYLGEKWSESILYIQLFSWAVLVRFVSSPVSMTLSILRKQEVGLILASCFLLIRYVVLVIYSSSRYEMVWALTISTAIYYASYLAAVYICVRRELFN